MKITEQNYRRLRLENPKFLPKGFSMIFKFGIVFCLAGLTGISCFAKLTILECDRDRLEASQVNCEINSSGLLGKRNTPIGTGIKQAQIEVNRGDDSDTYFLSDNETSSLTDYYFLGNSRAKIEVNIGNSHSQIEVSQGDDSDTYRVSLLTNNGNIPLTDYYSSGKSHFQRAKQINEFIRNQKQMSLIIKQDDRWFFLPLSLFLLVGIGCIYSTINLKTQTDCIFAKKLNRMYLKRQSIWQKIVSESDISQWRLQEIKQAQVLESIDGDGDKTYQTKLILKSGAPIDIEISGSKSEHDQIAQAINNFLGLSPA
jgi:hypothetical protein